MLILSLLLLLDLQTPGEEVLAALAKQPTPALLKEAAEIYRYPTSEAEATRLFEAAGAATKQADPVVRVAALRALASMGDPKAEIYLEPFLRQKNPKPDEKQALLTAIDAVGRLRIGSLIPSLLALAKTSKDPTVADQALLALGAYAESNMRERKRLVDQVLALAQSLQRNRGRWRRLRPPALRSLQLLTGQRLSSVELFAGWWKVAKERKDPFTPSSAGS
ncbi:MAG: HEAT repeat domain-containing protein [Planctomycetota bacterium]